LSRISELRQRRDQFVDGVGAVFVATGKAALSSIFPPDDALLRTPRGADL